MKKMIAIFSLLCSITTITLAQQKNLQLSFNLNPLDSYVVGEFGLSKNSTLYTAIGFGYGSVSSIHLNLYYDKSMHNKRNSDVVLPEIFFAPYLNIQYRNYFLKTSNTEQGRYTGNNSGMYIGARLKMYTSPVTAIKEDGMSIKQNYMFGFMFGHQKAFGSRKRFVYNSNMGVSRHANYNLSFSAVKFLAHASIGYVIK